MYNCYQGSYGTNMWNVNGNNSGNINPCGNQTPCNECIDLIKDKCILYTGINLADTGIDKNDTLAVIIAKLDAIKKTQDLKNTSLLAAINDINDRINAIDSGSHAAYTFL